MISVIWSLDYPTVDRPGLNLVSRNFVRFKCEPPHLLSLDDSLHFILCAPTCSLLPSNLAIKKFKTLSALATPSIDASQCTKKCSIAYTTLLSIPFPFRILDHQLIVNGKETAVKGSILHDVGKWALKQQLMGKNILLGPWVHHLNSVSVVLVIWDFGYFIMILFLSKHAASPQCSFTCVHFKPKLQQNVKYQGIHTHCPIYIIVILFPSFIYMQPGPSLLWKQNVKSLE